MKRGKGNAQNVTDWSSANIFLAGKDARTVVGIRSTVILRLQGGSIALRYHTTNVVVWKKDGSIVLHTGGCGYRTMTTKARICAFTPYYVYQWKHIWYVVLDREKRQNVKIFQDGMTILPFSPPVRDLLDIMDSDSNGIRIVYP